MSKPWGDPDLLLPMRETNLFGLQRVHIPVIQRNLKQLGMNASERDITRWMNRRENRVPSLRTALLLSQVLHKVFEFDQLECMYKLVKQEIPRNDTPAS